MKNEKLKGKDLINVGIYTAIYAVITFAIAMGRTTATEREVEAVAKAAGCDVLIRGLEKGYDTVVGGGGAHLSGGERQRIAIARAMLKNAPIVILDEATAYIDPENEAMIQKAVAKLVSGKTVIVIAHRLSTIINADQILVIKEGQVEAAGTHESLLESCPLYESMYSIVEKLAGASKVIKP